MRNDLNEPITLKQLAEITQADLTGDETAVVSDVTHDSRQAKPGSLFVAVRGELFDAHKFVPQVIERGAAGVLSELDPPEEWSSLAELQSGRGLAPAAWIKVDDVRRA